MAGMPIVSIPPFVIIAFELTILFGALLGVLGFLVHGRFPHSPRCPATSAVQQRPLRAGLRVPGGAAAARRAALRAAGAAEVTCECPLRRDRAAAFAVGLMLGAAGVGRRLPVESRHVSRRGGAAAGGPPRNLPAGNLPTHGGEPPMSREEAARCRTRSSPAPRTCSTASSSSRRTACRVTAATATGDGPVAFLMIVPPPDLTFAQPAERSDGYLYATIRNGGVVMPAYGDAMSAAERWEVVLYLRQLQGRCGAMTASAAARGERLLALWSSASPRLRAGAGTRHAARLGGVPREPALLARHRPGRRGGLGVAVPHAGALGRRQRLSSGGGLRGLSAARLPALLAAVPGRALLFPWVATRCRKRRRG